MRLLLLALIATSLSAASAPTMGWLPLPPGISWHGDRPAPAGAALVNRAVAIVVVDWQKRDGGSSGQGAFWALRGWWNDGSRPIDVRQGGMVLAVNGQLPNQEQDKADLFIKGQENAGGFLRAIGGDATAVVMLVDPDGRITHLERCTDGNGFAKEFDSILPKEGRGLVVNESGYALACKPALDLFRFADVKGALALCARKLGADGATLAKDVAARADVLIGDELVVLNDATAPASRRFLARGRIADLLAAFPGSSMAGEVSKAVKGLKGDKAYAAEEAGWAALQDYLAQAGKAQAKKLPELQKQLLDRIAAKHAGTYAADLAAMIRKAARIDP